MKRKTHRLFIKVRDEDKDMFVDERGRKFMLVKWVEVQEVNIGSLKNPKKKIMEVRLEPIRSENDDMRHRFFKFFEDD